MNEYYPAMSASKPVRKRLSAALAERPPARVTLFDAFRLARRRWLQGERIDIGALASELKVGRATLFRWVGSREQLLGEVLWSVTQPVLSQAAAHTPGHGAQRIAAICEVLIRAILGFAPLRRFITQNPEYALRLLTSKAGPVQARVIESVQTLLLEEQASGFLSLPLPAATLAYLVVRIGESFVYADVISGQCVEVGDAALAIELLLSGRLSAPGAPSARS